MRLEFKVFNEAIIMWACVVLVMEKRVNKTLRFRFDLQDICIPLSPNSCLTSYPFESDPIQNSCLFHISG